MCFSNAVVLGCNSHKAAKAGGLSPCLSVPLPLSPLSLHAIMSLSPLCVFVVSPICVNAVLSPLSFCVAVQVSMVEKKLFSIPLDVAHLSVQERVSSVC